MKLGLRMFCALSLLACATFAQAFDLKDLQAQLARPAVIHGPFTQEKHLRALAQPLLSKGNFVLAKDRGLLWLLKTPVQQDYRIDSQGISRRDPSGWQRLPGKTASAQQNQLFFAVLRGDNRGLERDFELALQGDAKHWQLHLTPRSMLLKQIFTGINISGADFVERIELLETQGDSTVLLMPASTSAASLSPEEQHDFAD